MGRQLLPESAVLQPRELALIDLAKEFRHQARHPPGSEEATGAFWQAMLEVAQDSPIDESLEEVARIHAAKNPDANAPYIAGIVRTAYRAYLEETDPSFDIQRLTTRESWREPLSRIAVALNEANFGSGDTATANLIVNLWTRQVQTNIIERYSAAELILQVTRERFPGGVNALDIGSGIMLGPLAMMDETARKRLRFRQVTNSSQPFRVYERRQAPLEYVNTLLERPSVLNGYACVDIAPIYNESRQAYDSGIIAWSKASRRPSEACDPLIDRLTANKPASVRFDMVNLADAEQFVEFKKQLGDKKFDFVSWCTAAHQMKPDERAAMFYNVKSILSPLGIAYIEDFASLQRPRSVSQPQSITDLHMLLRWHTPLSFRGFIYDHAMEARRRGIEQAFSFNDSRCAELTMSLASIAMNGERVPFHQAVRLAAA